MSLVNTIQQVLFDMHLNTLFIVGLLTFFGFYLGKSMKYVRLPSLIGFMIIGVLCGPSLLNILNESLRSQLSFIAEIALGFVAVSIGLELNFKAMKREGSTMALIIVSESLMAFILVTLGIYFFTRDIPLSLIFGAIAPASAPAGTVAIIHEYKAKGKLTRALYTVVGFDDGLGIIIFGFAFAIAKSIIIQSGGQVPASYWTLVFTPLKEILLSFLIGTGMSFLFSYLAKRLKDPRDLFIVLFASVLVTTGISIRFHLSLILSNMVLGLLIVNMQPDSLIRNIKKELTEVLPLLFILFFVLAGANLHIGALLSLGIIGLIYMVCRISGLMSGAWIGAVIGRAEKMIKRYLGMGILSQAGVAIGLALIVKQEFTKLGVEGTRIGTTVITTVTATSIVFEIIGPILTRIGLKKAGEIQQKQ
jgi:Kef-type K+ transport system membrane component KefB